MGRKGCLIDPLYQERYRQHGIYDSTIMNLIFDHEMFGLLNLYRAQAERKFTDEEAFFLQALPKL